MSEADGKCDYPRPEAAPPCKQHDDHTGHCDWWDQFAVPVIEHARAAAEAAIRHDETCAHCRRDAELDAARITRKQLDDAIGNARYMLAQWDTPDWDNGEDYEDTVEWAEDAARALRRILNATDALAGLSDE